jgi:hypothetical protein
MVRVSARGATAVVFAWFLLIGVLGVSAGRAGVLNPQISIIGQPFAAITDDAADPDRDRVRLAPGETEIVFDDYLNPYARGFFTLTLGEEGLELEEGYFTIFRGLPLEVALRGGQFRVPLGRLNEIHPHALPFAEAFGILEAYLPGEEAFIEPGVELQRRVPIAGDASVNLQLDWLQGNSFRIEREPSENESDPLLQDGDDGSELTRPGLLARLSGFSMLGERSALELGLSASSGTNNVAASARTSVFGADAKVKLWTSPRAYLLLQGELLALDREIASWEPEMGYRISSIDPVGGFLFADYNFGFRYNAGASYERFEEPTLEKPLTQSVGLFAGFALMEESTALRLDWRRVSPEGDEAFQTVTFRVIYSMGPHQAHQF